MKIFFILILSIACYEGHAQKSSAAADSLYFKQNWPLAISLYKTFLGDTSQSPLLWQRLANAQFQAGEYNDAIASYNKSLSNKPNQVLKNIILTNMLNIYNTQNKPAEALSFLDRQAENGFNNEMLVDTAAIFAGFKNDSKYIAIKNKVMLNAYPCLSVLHNADFDFWLGRWDVYITGTKNLIGRSVITREAGSCVILENWTSLVSPQTGISLNFVDPITGKWIQDYVGSGGTRQLYTSGEYHDGAMRFDYEGIYNNTPYPGHFFFYNEKPGLVRQVQDYSSDGGKTYITAYDYTYIRKS